ncbi:hypothetical protein ScalyP_jg7589 [Parmales sp. scaly parma]|nr:hypothetical protein ScalyP_jg7589 [Parmales sp. scaly parma]
MASFGDQKGRGNVFLSQAEKELQKFTFFSSSSKYENAAELLQKAGNCFKVSSSWQEAGDAYMKASELFTTKLSSSHEASAAMMDAGNCYKKVNPPQAINAFRGAIGLWTEAGRFNQAAKMLKEIAEMYEADKNAVEAIDNYTQASQFFETENQKSQANQCSAKIAELCSAALDPPDFRLAAELYEKLGRGCLDSALLKYNAKGYFVCAIFCLLAMGDSVAGRMKIDAFGAVDFSFLDSREGKLCDQLVEAVDNSDGDAMATACFEFDRVSKLDAWKTTILVSIKRGIVDNNGDDDDVDLS